MLFIRKATPDDTQQLAAIHAEAWRAAYKDIVPADQLALRGSYAYRLDFWKKELRKPHNEHFLAMEPFGPVGYFSLGAPRDDDMPPGTLELIAIYFLPQHWRRGYGTQCMSFVLNHCQEKEAKQVSLWVFEENQNARSFYRKLGFEPDGAKKTVAPDSPVWEIRLVRKL